MRALGAEAGGNEEQGWAKVKIDGKDWGRVLSVGRLSPKVVAGMFYFPLIILKNIGEPVILNLKFVYV